MSNLDTKSGLHAQFNKRESVKLGLILGVISLLLGIVILFVTKSLTSFWSITAFSYGINTILYVLVAVAFAYILRRKSGGVWTFSVALKSIFLMLLTATVLANVGTLIYVHYINPTLQQEVLYNTINVTIQYMEDSGAPDDIIDSSIAKLEEQIDSIGTVTFFQSLSGIAISILTQFIFALVLAAVTKNESIAVPKNFNP